MLDTALYGRVYHYCNNGTWKAVKLMVTSPDKSPTFNVYGSILFNKISNTSFLRCIVSKTVQTQITASHFATRLLKRLINNFVYPLYTHMGQNSSIQYNCITYLIFQRVVKLVELISSCSHTVAMQSS